MQINLNVKIKAGPRTPINVDVYGTSVNEKTVKLPNGATLSENHIADWIERELTKSLKKAAGEAPSR